MRSFFFGLPSSRVRTWLVARYYLLLVGQFRDGDFSFLRAVAPDAALGFFMFGTYQRPDGWKEALNTWKDSFSAGPAFELVEFFNPRAQPQVVLGMRAGGRGGSSGISIEAMAYFVIRVQEGMAVEGQLFRDREEAFAAIGIGANP